MITLEKRIKETTTLVELLTVLKCRVTPFSTPDFINMVDVNGRYRIAVEQGTAKVFSTKNTSEVFHAVQVKKVVAIDSKVL
ncbi:hypothetical protein VWH18_05935 [Escherichia coli O157]|nr:hypothetical protein [Escherichia coli O157]